MITLLHHSELSYFSDSDFELAKNGAHLVLLDSDIYLGKFSIELVIEITQFHPFIDQLFTCSLIIFLIWLYFLVVVLLTSLVHHGSWTFLEPRNKVVNAQDNMSQVEIEAESETCPPKSIKHINGVSHIVDVTLRDYSQEMNL